MNENIVIIYKRGEANEGIEGDEMIPKDKLKGNYITFRDNDGKYRTQKVVKIVGNTITVKDAVGIRKRIHPDKIKIFGVQYKKKIEEIEWK